MYEIESEVRTYVRRAMCECGGEYVRDYESPTLMTNPPQYTHKCNKCGDVLTSTISFPQLMHSWKDDDKEQEDKT